MHDPSEVDAVLELLATGLSDYEIARRSGVPRGTVWRWHRGGAPGSIDRRQGGCPDCGESPHEFDALPAGRYAYLLGQYLGDGTIFGNARSPSLRIYSDAAYPGLIDECYAALVAIRGRPPRLWRHPVRRLVTITSGWRAWPCLFPQHGPGPKHLRRIALTEWQREITGRHQRELLRGLIHSDGCRCLNRFETRLPSGRVATYEYPRYFFSNLSQDIRRIFCDHCDQLGIRWTQSNPRNISVSHRDSVAMLDQFVGPKR
jgi:transcriptional regulator with XRE-family HTH domain